MKVINRYYLFIFLKNLHFFGAVLVIFFTEWAGLSQFEIQLLQAWFMFWFFILEVPTGAVADYIGRKHSVSLGALVQTLAVLVYGCYPSLYIFALAEFLFAVAMSLISGADEAWLYDYLKEQKQESKFRKILGRKESFFQAGILIASLIGAVIANKISLNAPILLTSIPVFLSCLVAWSLPEPKRHQLKSESKRYLEIVKTGVVFFIRHPKLRILALDAIIVSACAYFVVWLYQPLLQQLNFPIGYFGIAHAFLLFTQIVVSMNFLLIDKIIKKTQLFFKQSLSLLNINYQAKQWVNRLINYQKISALMTAFGFFLVAFRINYVTMTIFLMTAGGFGLTRFAYLSSLINPDIPSQQRATVLSSISMFRRFSLMLMNPFIGYLASQSMSRTLFFLACLPLFVLFPSEYGISIKRYLFQRRNL